MQSVRNPNPFTQGEKHENVCTVRSRGGMPRGRDLRDLRRDGTPPSLRREGHGVHPDHLHGRGNPHRSRHEGDREPPELLRPEPRISRRRNLKKLIISGVIMGVLGDSYYAYHTQRPLDAGNVAAMIWIPLAAFMCGVAVYKVLNSK